MTVYLPKEDKSQDLKTLEMKLQSPGTFTQNSIYISKVKSLVAEIEEGMGEGVQTSG